MPAIDRFGLFEVIEAPGNNGMELTVLKLIPDVRQQEKHRMRIYEKNDTHLFCGHRNGSPLEIGSHLF